MIDKCMNSRNRLILKLSTEGSCLIFRKKNDYVEKSVEQVRLKSISKFQLFRANASCRTSIFAERSLAAKRLYSKDRKKIDVAGELLESCVV